MARGQTSETVPGCDLEGKQIIGRSRRRANIINPLCQEWSGKQVPAPASITLSPAQGQEPRIFRFDANSCPWRCEYWWLIDCEARQGSYRHGTRRNETFYAIRSETRKLSTHCEGKLNAVIHGSTTHYKLKLNLLCAPKWDKELFMHHEV